MLASVSIPTSLNIHGRLILAVRVQPSMMASSFRWMTIWQMLSNLSKVMQEHPEIGKMIKSSGGNYYCFPCLRGLESPNKTEFSSGFLYRADALADLGFDQVPETIDEWEEVLRAAKAAGYSKPVHDP